jgi:hypothetical protein
MTEPTLLQQARHFYDASDTLLMRGVPGVEAASLRNAVGRMLQHLEHLEQREEAMRAPAQVPSERQVNELIREASAHVVNVAIKTQVPGDIPWTPPGQCDGAKCAQCGEDGAHLNHAPYFNRASHPFVRPAAADGPAFADLDLDALQKLCDAATQGPWKHVGEGVVAAPNYATIASVADGAFIAAARDALPKLIELVRKTQPIADIVDQAPRCPKCHKAWLGERSHTMRRCVSDAFGNGCGVVWERGEAAHAR